MNIQIAREAPSGRLTGIEASRGIAAIIVILFHVARHLDRIVGAPMLQDVFKFGHSGVDFFFVISGFIILYVHYADLGVPARLGRYAGRRLTRLMPVYWVALALTVMMTSLGQHPAPSLAAMGWSISLLPSNTDLILGVAWTLRFEVLFYTLFSILILNRTAGLLAMGAWFTATAAAAVTSFHSDWLPDQFYAAYNFEFFMGMAAAWWLRNRPVTRPGWIALAGTLLFGATAATEVLGWLDGAGLMARLAYGTPGALIVLGVAALDRAGMVSVPALPRRAGAASYSIYLFQFVFIGAGWQLLRAAGLDPALPVIVMFVFLSGAAVMGGVLMSEWVEHPLMNLVRRRRAAAQPHPTMG